MTTTTHTIADLMTDRLTNVIVTPPESPAAAMCCIAMTIHGPHVTVTHPVVFPLLRAAADTPEAGSVARQILRATPTAFRRNWRTTAYHAQLAGLIDTQLAEPFIVFVIEHFGDAIANAAMDVIAANQTDAARVQAALN